jgi:hypothetical protein
LDIRIASDSFRGTIASAAANVRISSADLATSAPNLGLVSDPPRNARHPLGQSAQIRGPFRRTQRRRHAPRGFSISGTPMIFQHKVRPSRMIWRAAVQWPRESGPSMGLR